ncbi:MAG: ABC transporter permease [Candidatus Aureabacteria bacterium]|nr:ABC transporter permease [Candidatus Auribacterota bacterium]
MIKHWLFHRFLMFIPGLIGVSIVTFFIANAVPGDPVYALVGERADPFLIQQYRSKLGLDKTLPERYWFYLKTIISGDLGHSYYTGKNVGNELIRKFPHTFILAVCAMIFAVFSGLLIGTVCVMFQDRWLDRLFLFFSTFMISMPVFWLGMVFVFLFAVKIRLFPTGGMEGYLCIVLPALTLGSRSMGYLVRLTRTCLLDILNSEYILTARAKGAGPLLIIYHAMKNAMIPIATFIGLDFGSYLNGSVLTETIFNWDGIGRYAINGIFRRDYPVIIGSVLFGALIFMAVNLLIDLLYFYLNPQVKFQKQDSY